MKKPVTRRHSTRTLAVVFGDQLDLDAPLIASLDPARDVVLMMEVAAESTHVPSHVQRTLLFLSAMRHFAGALRERGISVRYVSLDDPDNSQSFDSEVARAGGELQPSEIACTHPGEWRVLRMVESWRERLGVPVRIVPDAHFLTDTETFAGWARGRASLTMEYFYREQRKRLGYLMKGRGRAATPEGGVWNFDKENRLPFGADGPKPPPRLPLRYKPDAVTRDVFKAMQRVLPNLPGTLGPKHSLESFAWPVTRAQALAALADFVTHRLANFGAYEDAMWTDTPYVYHSTLSAPLNLKLLNPRECCDAAIAAYRKGEAPLASVEAFVRQLIGWREFIRGVYWYEGEGYAQRNGLDSRGELPEFYWSGRTDMACMSHCVGQVVEHGFGHHIQRLMVTGNFALLAGVHPKKVSDWYLGMFIDGVDWVTLPNALGMVMHADKRSGSSPGVTGVVGTKPYAASGRYIDRMSNYCRGCRYDPEKRTGADACPFTVLYWDFLIRNRERLARNQRMTMILKNVDRLDDGVRVEITTSAATLRRRLGVE
jgi:deoxyribodipyrimidine photolyase-related protein